MTDRSWFLARALFVVVMLVIAAALLATCVHLVSSGAFSGPPKSGTVIDKRFEPAHWESGYRTEYQSRYSCKTESRYNYDTDQYERVEDCGYHSELVQVYESHHHYVRDAWALKLRKCKEADGKEKCRTGWRTVSSGEHERFDVGDYYGGDE